MKDWKEELKDKIYEYFETSDPHADLEDWSVGGTTDFIVELFQEYKGSIISQTRRETLEEVREWTKTMKYPHNEMEAYSKVIDGFNQAIDEMLLFLDKQENNEK